MICPKCGAAIEGGYHYITCPNCGRTFDSTQFDNADELEPKPDPKPATVSEPMSTPVFESDPTHTPESAFSPEMETNYNMSLSSDSEPTLDPMLTPETIIDFESTLVQKHSTEPELTLNSEIESDTAPALDPGSASAPELMTTPAPESEIVADFKPDPVPEPESVRTAERSHLSVMTF